MYLCVYCNFSCPSQNLKVVLAVSLSLTLSSKLAPSLSLLSVYLSPYCYPPCLGSGSHFFYFIVLSANSLVPCTLPQCWQEHVLIPGSVHIIFSTWNPSMTSCRIQPYLNALIQKVFHYLASAYLTFSASTPF